MKAHAVTVNKFSFWYGDFQALFDLTFNIPSLQITALIGPSGCGKSTFLKCLNRISERGGTARWAGSVQVFGNDIYHPINSLPEIRKSIGMVFQKPNPLPLSVYENVIFGARTHLKRDELKKDLLDGMVESSLRKVGMWTESRLTYLRRGWWRRDGMWRVRSPRSPGRRADPPRWHGCSDGDGARDPHGAEERGD